MSKICKVRGRCEYIKYDENTKLEVLNIITKYGYTRLEMPNHVDWIIYAKFDPSTREFESNIEILVPGDYIVLLDDTRLGHYDEVIFNATFYDEELGE